MVSLVLVSRFHVLLSLGVSQGQGTLLCAGQVDENRQMTNLTHNPYGSMHSFLPGEQESSGLSLKLPCFTSIVVMLVCTDYSNFASLKF